MRPAPRWTTRPATNAALHRCPGLGPGRGTGTGDWPAPTLPASRCLHRWLLTRPAKKGETEMGKIVVSTNVTLDGVVQDPDGAEGFGHGGWFGQFGGKDLEQWGKVSLDEALGTEALLLGRRSDEWFATRWASRTGEWADRLNSLPKYVVSSSLEDPGWSNSTVLPGDDVVAEVSKLKKELAGELVVYASYKLGRPLIN